MLDIVVSMSGTNSSSESSKTGICIYFPNKFFRTTSFSHELPLPYEASSFETIYSLSEGRS